MASRDLVKIERQLIADICNPDAAVLERVNDLIEQHLIWLAGEVAHQRITDMKGVNDLIRLHARTRLLEVLIRDPTKLTLKEQKLLLNDVTLEAQSKPPGETEGKRDVVKFIEGLDVSDSQKARLLGEAIEAVRSKG